MSVELEINGEKVQAVYSVWTLALYEQEFDGANMLSDLFGVVEINAKAKNAAMTLDFTANDWTKLAKAVWAGVKCADDSTLPFKEWARKATDIDMFEIANKVPLEVMRRCFRAGAGPTA